MRNLRKLIATLLLAFVVFCNVAPDPSPSTLVCGNESEMETNTSRDNFIC